jgi:hypothetical protein
MRKPHSRIPLEKEEVLLEQYDNPYGEAMDKHESDYSVAIGRFLISFSYLENALDSLVSQAIHSGTDEAGYRVIKYLNYRNKVNLALDIYRQVLSFITKKRLKELNTKRLEIVTAKLIELGEFRNKIAHANWMTVDRRGYVRVKMLEDHNKGRLMFEKIKMTPNIIYKFTRQCHAVASKIDVFKDEIWQSI